MLVSGCTRDWKFQPNDMWNKSRLKPYEPIGLAEGVEVSASRPLPQGVIARGQLRIDEAMYNGTLNGRLVTTIPAAAMQGVTMRQMVERGKERYDIYCLPCHGIVGNGDGMVTKRGMAVPPSYSLPRLREAPIGHFYDVITNGYGAMYSYASRVPPRDRWAIASYIRVLQRSQNASAADIPAAERGNVKTPEQILGTRAPMSQTPGMPGEMPLPNTSKKPFGEPAASPNDKAGQPTD
jgi:mono/diheme cytochrome c family protein